jgi:hypothetical protein
MFRPAWIAGCSHESSIPPPRSTCCGRRARRRNDRLAQRLSPGEDPDALAHDVLESLLAGFTTNLGTTFCRRGLRVMSEPVALRERPNHA